jgi:peptidoglycan hydrolase FlgJ
MIMAAAAVGTALNLLGAALRRDETPASTPIADTKNPEKVKEAAQDFEAFFVARSFEDMFAGLDTDPMFGGGEGEEMFKTFLMQEYGKSVAKAGGIGISDMVQRELLQLQETGK